MTANSMETALGVWRIRNPVTRHPEGRRPGARGERRPRVTPAVTDLGRNDAAIKSMNDYHLASGSAVKYAVKNGALFEFACGRGGDMNRWAAGGFARGGVRRVSGQPRQPPGWHLPAHVTSRTKLPPWCSSRWTARRACTRRWMTSAPPQPRAPLRALRSPLEPGRGGPWRSSDSAAPWLGFDLTSCQFAVHMFESDDALDRFIGNVAYATRLGALHRDDL
jgi:hypothetical protein